MNLRQRISEILQIITQNIPEREYYVQLAFLTALIQEPFYLYGRARESLAKLTHRIKAGQGQGSRPRLRSQAEGSEEPD